MTQRQIVGEIRLIVCQVAQKADYFWGQFELFFPNCNPVSAKFPVSSTSKPSLWRVVAKRAKSFEN
jgi:hypothetical protein